MTSLNRFTSLVVLAIATSTVSAAENWPQWRGPGSQGISPRRSCQQRGRPPGTSRGRPNCQPGTPRQSSGEIKYEGGRPPVAARFTGSPVAFGGFIAMTSEDGETFMLKAGPHHEIVRTNSVDEPVYSSLAIANGRIYIRAEKHRYAVSLSPERVTRQSKD